MTSVSRRDFLQAGAFAVMATGVRGQAIKPQLTSVKALVFDTFGTVVDWRSSVIAEGQRLGKEKHLDGERGKCAAAWRAGDGPRVGRGGKGGGPRAKAEG